MLGYFAAQISIHPKATIAPEQLERLEAGRGVCRQLWWR